jgi:hypothetical protein
MKKLVLFSCLVFASSTSVFAAGYKSAGCGLGSEIITDGGFVQVFAATTNDTLGTQTFGISSGTSNCESAGGVASNDTEKNMYVSSNHDVITQEMTQGSGEHLKALSTLMGCDQAHSDQFAQVMKKNYRSIASDSPKTLLENVKSSVSADPVLKTACNS